MWTIAEFGRTGSKRMRKAAILGSATSSLNQAPFNDASWEIWALGPEQRRVTRYYEIHTPEQVKPELRERYNKTTAEVYTLSCLPDVPAAFKYPLEQVVAVIGGDYFASSIGYMFGHLIYEHLMAKTQDEKFSEVAIFGVDMLLDEEYAMQRPNCEYLLGICKGLGILVHVPDSSALLKVNSPYGRAKKTEITGPFNVDYFQKQLNEYTKIKQQILTDFNKITGVIEITQVNLDRCKNFERGGIVPV